MSPVAPSGSHAGRALLVATVGVIVALGALFLASLALSGRNSPSVHLGDWAKYTQAWTGPARRTGT